MTWRCLRKGDREGPTLGRGKASRKQEKGRRAHPCATRGKKGKQNHPQAVLHGTTSAAPHRRGKRTTGRPQVQETGVPRGGVPGGKKSIQGKKATMNRERKPTKKLTHPRSDRAWKKGFKTKKKKKEFESRKKSVKA